MDKLKIEYVDINNIKPYKKNPRKNEEAIPYVMESIKQFGFKNPVILDKDNVIVAGHTRIESAKRLGITEIPCIYADDLTDEQIKAFRLADNKVAEIAEWDIDLLDTELDDILNIDMSDFGFDLDLEDEEEQEIIEDEVPDVPEEPKAKLGDIYQLGNHRLMCGDSTKEEDVAKLMNGNKADMVFTDPPYGMFLNTDFSDMHSKMNTDFGDREMKGGKYKKVKGDNEDFKPIFINTIFDNFGYCKEIFTWGADYYAELLPNKNDGSWIVWDKRQNENETDLDDNPMDKGYGSCFELCWSKNRHKRDIARIRWAGLFGMEKDDTKKRVHPTQKPSILAEWFINKYNKKQNATIVDLYGGSGSTLIACEKTNNVCYCMEYEPMYVDVIIQRWENFTGEKAIKLN